MERNLDGDISHAVPDISIDGKLSSLQLSADPLQYQLIRGLLEHNFGEPLEEFQTQLLPHFKDPRPQVVMFLVAQSEIFCIYLNYSFSRAEFDEWCYYT